MTLWKIISHLIIHYQLHCVFSLNAKIAPIAEGIARLIIHRLIEAAIIPGVFSEKLPIKITVREDRIPGSVTGIPGRKKRNK